VRCPGLSDLPPPPPGRLGWPWTEESPPAENESSDEAPWPRISIITPSLNQADFLEEAIRSVLLQGYPDVEYILIDGGSSDGSVEIIRKYEAWVAYWVSEPDEGQASAINKGFKRAGGDIVAWLNSDDFYLQGTFHGAALFLCGHPNVKVAFGDAVFVDESGRRLQAYRGVEHGCIRNMMYWKGWDIPQPSVFMRKEVVAEMGYLNESYRYAMDYEYFLRTSMQYPFRHTGKALAAYRIHHKSKTGDWEQNKTKFFRECRRANSELLPQRSPLRPTLQFMKTVHDVCSEIKKRIRGSH
jgi:glycosyltransferase involved in cell wall biosynthesis